MGAFIGLIVTCLIAFVYGHFLSVIGSRMLGIEWWILVGLFAAQTFVSFINGYILARKVKEEEIKHGQER